MDEMHFSNKLLQRKIFVNSSLFIVLKQIVIKKFSLIYKGLRTKFFINLVVSAEEDSHPIKKDVEKKFFHDTKGLQSFCLKP